MGALFVYILKAAVCLSLFYLFYRLLLSRETFHRFNRIAVLGILMISLLIPFCEVKVTEQTEMHQTVLSLEQLLLLADMMEEAPVVETQNEKAVWIHVILYVYLAGIFFFICRNIYSLIRLGLLLKSSEKEKLEDKVTLIIHDKSDLAPFSWMRYVVISRKDLEENGREILTHELAHIHKRHSIDLLIADICIFFQWFNPAAWLLKQELQNIHEYEADESVIKEGVDAKQYQLLLIKKAVGTRLYSMANSFNHSKLKKRITMMLKEKSSPWARLKYLYVLPLAAIAVSAFARPEISNELKEISKVKVNDLNAITVTNTEENLADSAKVKVIGIGPMTTTSVSVSSFEKDKEPLVIVDGKGIPNNDLNSIDPYEIYSMDILKTETATELYGDKGTNGVILITLMTEEQKKNLQERQGETTVLQLTGVNSYQASGAEGKFDTTKPESEADMVAVVGFAESKVNVTAGQMSLNADNIKFSKPQGVVTLGGLGDKEPLIIVNGKEIDYAVMSALDPESIESIDVLKDATSTQIYGERGKNGVVIITLKSAADMAKSIPTTGSFIGDVKTQIQGTPIVIVDGKEVNSLDAIDPSTIKSLNVLKDISAANENEVKLFEKYGERAKDGFILVTSKKPDDNTGIQVFGVQRSRGISVDGLVTDESGKPIVGAAVVVSGTTVGTVTNTDGKFYVMAPDKALLTISYVNMEKVKVKVAPNVVVRLKAE